MRFDGCGILGRVVRPHGHMAEPEPPQQGADAALGQMYAEAGLDHLRQVDPAPADHATTTARGATTPAGGAGVWDVGLGWPRRASGTAAEAIREDFTKPRRVRFFRIGTLKFVLPGHIRQRSPS